MEKTVTLHYTESLVRSSVLYYCWAMSGRLFALTFILSLLSLILLLQDSGSTPQVIFIGVSLLLVAAFWALIYIVTKKRALRKFNALENGRAVLTMDDNGLSISSATIPWTAITKIKKYKEFWIVLLDRHQYFTLPLDSLSEDDQSAFLKFAQ